jgi:hypothetical protein
MTDGNNNNNIASIAGVATDIGSSNNSSGVDRRSSGRNRERIKSAIKAKLRNRAGIRSVESDRESDSTDTGISAEVTSADGTSDRDDGRIRRRSRRGRRGTRRSESNGSFSGEDRDESRLTDSGNGAETDQESFDASENTIRLDFFEEEEPEKTSRRSFSGSRKQSKNETIIALADAVAVPFYLTSVILNEQHWLLTKEEKFDLAVALDRFLRSLPKSRLNRVRKALDKYLPGLQFAFVFGVITYPRFVQSKLYGKITGIEETVKEKNLGD